MRILVTNDDGIEAAGIAALARLAAATGKTVTVAAPAGERSGSAAALSVFQPENERVMKKVRCDSAPLAEAFSVRASPAMITVLATEGEFGPPPDLVLSGINHGPNTGSAVLHSGTVGAAFTAAARGIPALAFSMVAKDIPQWETADVVVSRVIEWGAVHAPHGLVVNVNIPDVPLAGLRGLRQARLAPFGAAQAQVTTFAHSETITMSSHEETEQPDSDAALLAAGWATVTAVAAPFEIATDLDTLLGPA